MQGARLRLSLKEEVPAAKNSMEIKPVHIALGVLGAGALYFILKPKAVVAQGTTGVSAVVSPPVGTTEVAPVQLAKTSDFKAATAANFVLDTSGKTNTTTPKPATP